jgi:cell division protein ZapA
MATKRGQNSPITVENVSVQIMGREYAFACAPEEKQSLLECVALVDGKMNAIKAMGKLSATERIAVMAALTIVNELKAENATLNSRDAKVLSEHTKDLNLGLDSGAMRPRIESLNQEIEVFLAEHSRQESLRQKPLFD